MSGVEKISTKIDKSCTYRGLDPLETVERNSLVVHLLNKHGDMWVTSFGSSLPI